MKLASLQRAARAVGGRLLAGALAASALVLAGCAIGGGQGGLPAVAIGQEAAPGTEPGPAPARPARAKVALLLPLSAAGPAAVVAKAMKQAGELALFEHDGQGLQLIVKDDQGTPEGAQRAAEEAVGEGAELILGPLMSASVQAVAPVARNARVPVIAFSNDRQVAGAGVWLIGFHPEQEVERIVGYARAQGRSGFAALVSDDAYGRMMEAAFTRAVERAGGSLAGIERYQGSAMLEPMRRLAEAMSQDGEAGRGADTLYVPGSPETLASLGPLLAYARIDTGRVKLIGSGGWDGANVGREAALAGGWFPAPDPRGWQAFAEKFAKTFGTMPPRIATLAFDAVGFAATLAAGPAQSRFAAASLTRPAGYSGADGPLRLLPDGLAERSLAVLEVQGHGARVIDPPASGFGVGQASGLPARVN